MIYTSQDQLIGNTPMLKLSRLCDTLGIRANIIAKLECFNPAGSVKDRVAREMLDSLLRDGKINKDSVIIEPTSGNTGIGLAAVAASRGYRVIIVMPDTMSTERRKIMTAYGAELVLTDGKGGMALAIEKAEELCQSIPGAVIAGQFTNPKNPEAHYLTTGPEIYRDMQGEVDFFVAGVGTGGTITGVGRYLKEQSDKVKIIAAEPKNSAVLSGESAGAHKIQGIGAGFVPEVLDTQIYDEIVKVSDEDSYKYARLFGRVEGVLVGISSGCALAAAIEIASRKENEGKNIVVLLPDGGEKYLSSGLYD